MLKGAAAQAAAEGVSPADEQAQAASVLQTALRADPSLIHQVRTTLGCKTTVGGQLTQRADSMLQHAPGDGGRGASKQQAGVLGGPEQTVCKS